MTFVVFATTLFRSSHSTHRAGPRRGTHHRRVAVDRVHVALCADPAPLGSFADMSARTRLIALSMLPTSEWRRAPAAWQPNGDLFGWRGLSFLTTAAVALVAFALATPGFTRTSALHMPWPVEFAQFRMFGFGVRLLHGFVQSMWLSLRPARATATAGRSTCSSSSSGRRSAQSSMASTLGVRGSRRRFLPVRSFCRSCRAWTSAA